MIRRVFHLSSRVAPVQGGAGLQFPPAPKRCSAIRPSMQWLGCNGFSKFNNCVCLNESRLVQRLCVGIICFSLPYALPFPDRPGMHMCNFRIVPGREWQQLQCRDQMM
jgi:hypothetical protein